MRALRDWLATDAGWPDAVAPAYDGGSVANVVPTILHGFRVAPAPPGRLARLHESLLPSALLDGARTIVLVVLDAWGEALRAHAAPSLTGAHHRSTLTSVFPSTTAAALTSLQTGVAPGTHGVAGYTLYFPAVRRIVNMVTFRPVDGSAVDGALVDPLRLLPVPTISATLARAGVESLVVSHKEYQRSPLTQLHHGDIPYTGHRTLAEFAHLLASAALEPSAGPRFIFGYWAGIDILAHRWGPASAIVRAEVELVEQALAHWVVEPILASGQEIVLLITADHGQRAVPDEAICQLHRLAPETGWRHPPSGERRAVGLALVDRAQRESVRALAGDAGVVLDIDDAIGHGLFGPGPIHPDLRARVGDALLLARGDATFPYRPTRDLPEPSFGAHGSLTADEMLVPLLAWRAGHGRAR